MEIRKYDKMVKVDYISLNGIEFETRDLFGALEELSNTKADDKWGEYSLREYELNYYDSIKKLVDLGYVKNYTGSRMANLYCIANEEEFKELKEKLYSLYN